MPIDLSRMPIDQECKRCGKTFRNKGYLYCSKDCQLMDGHWNYTEIKSERIRERQRGK